MLHLSFFLSFPATEHVRLQQRKVRKWRSKKRVPTVTHGITWPVMCVRLCLDRTCPAALIRPTDQTCYRIERSNKPEIQQRNMRKKKVKKDVTAPSPPKEPSKKDKDAATQTKETPRPTPGAGLPAPLLAMLRSHGPYQANDTPR